MNKIRNTLFKLLFNKEYEQLKQNIQRITHLETHSNNQFSQLMNLNAQIGDLKKELKKLRPYNKKVKLEGITSKKVEKFIKKLNPTKGYEVLDKTYKVPTWKAVFEFCKWWKQNKWTPRIEDIHDCDDYRREWLYDFKKWIPSAAFGQVTLTRPDYRHDAIIGLCKDSKNKLVTIFVDPERNKRWKYKYEKATSYEIIEI